MYYTGKKILKVGGEKSTDFVFYFSNSVIISYLLKVGWQSDNQLSSALYLPTLLKRGNGFNKSCLFAFVFIFRFNQSV